MNPVAMPPPYGYLDEYFKGLSKLDFADESRNKQVGGKHYHQGNGIQPWDIIKAWELDFWEGNVLKYVLRYKHKDGVQDLKKARHYLDYLIERGKVDGIKTKGDIDGCGK